jgi:hypothetical protein
MLPMLPSPSNNRLLSLSVVVFFFFFFLSELIDKLVQLSRLVIV